MSTDKHTPVVFYSWQSDLPNKTNRGLIEEALEKACKDLSAELELAIRVDADIQGESGSPDIAATILEKIEKATVVVADVSIIGIASVTDSDPPATRPVPNPNVMVELGYAKKALGTKRVIMVCNTAFGRIEDLPFDIRGKGVVNYSHKGDQDNKPAGPRNDLRGKLKSAIASALETARAGDHSNEVADEKETKRMQTEQFQSLRARRVQGVLSAPSVPLVERAAIIVLHVVPAISLDEKARIDLQHKPEQIVTVEMIPYGTLNSFRWVNDVDSISSTASSYEDDTYGYTRLFQSGAFEYVALLPSNDSGPQLNTVAHVSIKAFAKVIPALEKLGLQGRCFVALDVLRTKNGRIVVDRAWFPPDNKGRAITQELLSPPQAVAESPKPNDASSLLKPALDWIWRAAGFAKCFYYDDEGKFGRQLSE